MSVFQNSRHVGQSPNICIPFSAVSVPRPLELELVNQFYLMTSLRRPPTHLLPLVHASSYEVLTLSLCRGHGLHSRLVHRILTPNAQPSLMSTPSTAGTKRCATSAASVLSDWTVTADRVRKRLSFSSTGESAALPLAATAVNHSRFVIYRVSSLTVTFTRRLQLFCRCSCRCSCQRRVRQQRRCHFVLMISHNWEAISRRP